VRKVRDRYNDYIIRYMKPPSVKEDFEFRYAQVRRINADISSFLHAEISALKELIQREEQRLLQKTAPRKKEKGPDFADRIMEQHRKQIEKYPDLELPANASFEIRKLFGMLKAFDAEYWTDVLKLMREIKAVVGYGARTRLEALEADLCVPLRNTVPAALHRYCLLVDSPDPDWYAVEKEQKNCILAAAFFLHRAVNICEAGLKMGELEEEMQKRVENVLIFLHSVLTDFRLRDLKPADLEEFYNGRGSNNY
jgi:hypothetical protein